MKEEEQLPKWDLTLLYKDYEDDNILKDYDNVFLRYENLLKIKNVLSYDNFDIDLVYKILTEYEKIQILLTKIYLFFILIMMLIIKMNILKLV